jgi:Na+/H+ antiporter NhaC
MSETNWGLWSLTPLLVTLVLAFVTRSALIAMLVGCFIGTLMVGAMPGSGLNALFQDSLGNADFIWICQIVVLIGVLFECFKHSGVLVALPQKLRGDGAGRRRVELTAWGMGFLIVDDYFSPLMTGAVVRPMASQARIPSEKLAFILDATTASVCILVPFTAWGAYMASLIAAQGDAFGSVEAALGTFIAAIPYNFYPMGLLIFALLICAGWLPDFGPMRRAEERVRVTGELIRSGANPLVDTEIDWDRPTDDVSIFQELVLPTLIIIGIGAGSLVMSGSVKIVEAFLAGVTVAMLVLLLRRKLTRSGEAAKLIFAGAQSVMPALLIVALAYSLNGVAQQLGVGGAIVGLFSAQLSADWLVALTFIITAAISFATGTSWGAFALMMPVALPVAMSYSGNEITPLVLQTIAAISGGGIFGDHASPVSDTTVLASLGAGSDHMDHVLTQLPYAVVVASLCVVAYVLL